MDDVETSDDSISLTSTVNSDKVENYEVERILAEKNSNGVTEYLTAWKGYPETEHLWLPRQNFDQDDTFIDWTNTQKRVANGLEKPFDVRAWQKRCKAVRLATKLRKERRQLKRLRLSRQNESPSGLREQGGSIQRSGSGSAPKRSDKRIKRRSVHQDSPPSSSTSGPASSSGSEDSDRPLISRQESETFTPNPKWTQAETVALEEGLRTLKGPRWRELLGLYGRKGKINRDLGDRTPGDLYDKAKTMCQEFLDSGREPPEYLKPFSNPASSKGPQTSTPNVCPENGPRANEPLSTSTITRVESHKSVIPTTADSAQPEITHTNVPQNSESMRGEKARNTWSGTARAPTARPSVSNRPRSEAVENRSNQPGSMNLKPKHGQIEPKKPSSTGDVTAAWNAEPKKRKSNNWATENADPVEGQPTKRNYSLSVQNKIFKSRRDGGPPDPNRLIFIDPKTGKAPTKVSTPSAPVTLSRTPLQPQEKPTTREAEGRQAQEVGGAMTGSTTEPDPLPQVIEQSHKTKSDEQRVLDREKQIPTTSESVLKATTGDTTDGPSNMDKPMPTGPASSHPDPPLNAPLGPKDETKRLATMFLQDYSTPSVASRHPSNEAVINTNRSYSSGNPSHFTLRAFPRQEDQLELFRQPQQNLVIGDIKLGEDNSERIKVKLVGFSSEVRRLLLTTKLQPRELDLIFRSVCLASEYKAYFPAKPSDYLGSGSIVSYHQSASAVENIVEILANNLQGGIFFAQQYTMLMYPAGASAWAFLDKDLPSVHPGTVLRFAVREPLLSVPADIHRLATAGHTRIEPEQHAEITTKLQNHRIQAKDKNINIVFRDMFEIDFDRLVAQNGDQPHPLSKIFFLCFIPQGCEAYEPDTAKRSALRVRTSQEHDLFIKFLQANGAEEIYSMQKMDSQEIEREGAWDYFCKKVKSGTIIFHDAMIRFDLVPRLAKHLLRGSVNVWKTSLSPMHPSEKHPHLVRLFPHGGVLLLTESLILYQPRESLRMLMWFRRVHVPAKAPGTWKLAVRPRIREWLLDIIDAYSDSGKDIFGCRIQIFADIYTEIYWLLQSPDPGKSGLMCQQWDYEVPTDEALIVTSASLRDLQARKEWKGEGDDTGPDDGHIRENDDLLAEWFAAWAIVNLPNFRKFHIILGYTKDHPFTSTAISAYERAWGHLEVMTFEDACNRHKVTPQDKLDQMEAERRRKLKESLPARKAAAEKARREEREAARLALIARMQMFRDAGATDEEVISAGRKLLRDLGGSEREVEECRVDMERVFGGRWWERDPVHEKDGGVSGDGMDTT